MSRVQRAAVAGCLLLTLSAAAAAEEPFIKGVALGLFSHVKGYSYERELDEIKRLNANAISLVVNINQGSVYSETVSPSPAAASPETIARVAAGAHARGMSVFLFPIIYIIDVRPGKWRGTIAPPSWERWFESYGAVIQMYADLAEKNGIEMLLVGCELVSSEKNRDLWLDLIARIRLRYRGKLLYSSNWDHLTKDGFIEKLDCLGSNGYFELANSNRPNKQELLWNWKRVQEKYSSWQARYGKPLVFTEIGYPSVDGCSRNPWDYTTTNPVDVDEQALCYSAFAEAWSGVPYLKGAFFYAWYGEGGPGDRSYTPRGKPAEAILRNWFLNLR